MITDEMRAQLRRVVAVSIVKGGQGKTTVTANLAVHFASVGKRVLVIDFDPQRNLRNNLGYRDEGIDDRGAELLSAMSEGRPLQPFNTNRPNLDVVPGGPRLIELQERLILAKYASHLGAVVQNAGSAYDSGADVDTSAIERLALVLAPIAGDYDFVFIDCPPDMGIMQQEALAAAQYVLVSLTKGDDNALDGVESLGEALREVRPINPYLRMLGVVAFGFRPQSKTRLANAIESVDEILGATQVAGGGRPTFQSVIRDAPSVPVLEQQRGRTSGELAVDYERQEPFWKALRRKDKVDDRVAGSVVGVAADFSALAGEVEERIAKAEGAAS